ncbi:histidinol-phosphatase HisJ [Bacillus sp. JCM 19041]|uniref:histidinol-phosphatase HisJ n=1 Tax=Bacillus sp. JCM 19041 TaxID=1460637 RepID=UPI000A443A9F
MPHGSADTWATYCEAAIKLGLKTITFTEHAPLPANFIDPTPQSDSAMNVHDLALYLSDIAQLKKEYASALDIHTGLEVDFITGYEQEITSLLNEIGLSLDDSILSIHFLNIHGKNYCMDYSPAVFEGMAHSLGSIDAVYALYFQTLLQSVYADLGPYKPKRIGHITLCRKFQKKLPATHDFTNEITDVLTAIKERGLELDYNGAGLSKPDCGETYPPLKVAEQAKKMGIKLIYGSDAHSAAGLMAGAKEIR